MEKVKEYEVRKQSRVHEFYCDNCGKYLGGSEEYEDGYYKTPFNYEYRVLLNSKWYKNKRTLCDYCKLKFEEKYIETLKKLGF